MQVVEPLYESNLKETSFSNPSFNKLNVEQSSSNLKFSMSTTSSTKLIAIFEIFLHFRKIQEMFERFSFVPSTFNSFS